MPLWFTFGHSRRLDWVDNVVVADDDRWVETTIATGEVYQLGLCSSELDLIGFAICQDVSDVLCKVLGVLLEVAPPIDPLEANVVCIAKSKVRVELE
jgi:hypothetical protein